ncbi:unnamed protein product [Heligmosomoides polygyrus]|uniref:DUF385 domain-containing protein n=1 Tax=Heligmosomoides polygyrus TaxID=6339 RepID=A0A183F1U4_HELPZ|nr:unnamed protein product [Heligmosomoides polygyrus]
MRKLAVRSLCVALFVFATFYMFVVNFKTNILPVLRASALIELRNRSPSNKWIVITTVNNPTDDIKRLAKIPGWSVVVVGDEKTPKNWSVPGVHFLSVDTQLSLGYGIVENLPYKSYTRKNIGYLYAIEHGAEWIYDTDDDNKPYGADFLRITVNTVNKSS